ncbi:MAG: ATP-binding protein [Actinomycetota bacterium]
MVGAATRTFLFTDLVGSTELLTRLGDEAAVAVHHRVDELLRSCLRVNGGREIKHLGDGLMVAFSGAGEAVAAASEMQKAVTASDLGVSVRIGVNSGEAIAHGDDYQGTPVVIAERLCGLATGGQILVSAVVRELVGNLGGFSFASHGPHRLKGLAAPTDVWEVKWEEPAANGLTAPVSIGYPGVLNQPAGGHLIGRDEVLTRLDGVWTRVAQGLRRLVLLAGEPGIGKTAMAAAWSRTAHERGAVVVAGRCAPETVIAYQPFVEILHQLLADTGAAAAISSLGPQTAELRRLVPDLAGLLPARPGVQAEAGTERYLLYESVVSALHQVADQVPTIAVLDDLHWADAPTIGLLEHLTRHPRQSRLLVIGTYRETELSRSHPLAASLAELRRERRFERIHLSGLHQDGVADLISDRTGEKVPNDAATEIWNETEGNPFFVEEVVANLMESGTIGPGIPWPEATELHRLEIPEGIREVVGRRLSRLDQATNRMLVLASVIGREFDGQLLEELSEAGAEAVADQIDEALAARILLEAPLVRGRYTFSHALIRQTLYEELNPTRRSRLHRRVAEALSTRGGSPAELALHFTAAHDPTRALEASVAAAVAADNMLAFGEVARHYRHAVELWDEVADPVKVSGLDKAELLQRAAEATHLLDGGLGEAIELAHEAERLLDPVIAPTQSGSVAERLSRYLYLAGRGGEALAAIERSIALIPPNPPSPERAKALANQASLLMLMSRNRESEEGSLEAIAVARRVEARAVEGNALVTLGSVEGADGRIESAIAHILEGRRISEQEGVVEDVLRSYVNLSSILDETGRLEAAVADAKAGSEAAARWHIYGKYFWFPRCNAAYSLIRLGRWQEAADHIQLGQGLAHAEGVSEVFVLSLKALLSLLTGDLEMARRYVDELLPKSTEIVDPQFQGPIHWVAAQLVSLEGSPEDAWEVVQRGLDLVEKGEDWFWRAPLYTFGTRVLADLALAGNEPARRRQDAVILVRTLEAAEGEAGASDFPAQLAQTRAELTRFDGNRHPPTWARAADLWASIPQPYEVAYCRFRQGQALIATGDEAGGMALFEETTEVADRLGAVPLRRAIDAARP